MRDTHRSSIIPRTNFWVRSPFFHEWIATSWRTLRMTRPACLLRVGRRAEGQSTISPSLLSSDRTRTHFAAARSTYVIGVVRRRGGVAMKPLRVTRRPRERSAASDERAPWCSRHSAGCIPRIAACERAYEQVESQRCDTSTTREPAVAPISFRPHSSALFPFPSTSSSSALTH